MIEYKRDNVDVNANANDNKNIMSDNPAGDKIFVGTEVLGGDKPIIIIDDTGTEPADTDVDVDAGADNGGGEIPTIIIEHEEERKPVRRWIWFVVGAVVAALLCAVAVGLYKYLNAGLVGSVSPEQNIEALEQPVDMSVEPEVVVTSDSILGVKLNFYEIRGVKADVSFVEPSPNDRSVYLYSRCADYDMNNEVIGTLVEKGREIMIDNSRLGYCAMANGNVVIGVSESEAVKDYVMERDGSFFRQFVLVADFRLPQQFQLHGKVERRAFGRLVGGEHPGLYYIETVHPETMYDFADALREYGFVDAIYITGGKAYSYYRSKDGVLHQIGGGRSFRRTIRRTQIPYVVFRKR